MSEVEQSLNVNELIKVRHDKLKDLQEKGKDPFHITKFDVNAPTLKICAAKDVYISLP